MAVRDTMSRYARQITLAPVGPDGQARLGRARVLVVGAGGLAAPLLPLLAGAGVGQITIVDGDRVALSNLHRQTLFTEADCGAPKAQLAARRCEQLNSDIRVTALDRALTPANAPALIAGADLVLDCADSYAVSYLLSDLCLASKTPFISASVLGLGGYVGGFCGAAPSLRAVFPDPPDSSASCATAGVLGPVVGIVGAMQAQMALKVLLELEPAPLGMLIQLDGLTLKTTSFRFDNAPEPAAPLRFVAAASLSPDDCIVELRADAPLLHPSAMRLSPEDLPSRLPRMTDTRLALCCATGLRAWRAGDAVRSIWPGEIVLVAASAS